MSNESPMDAAIASELGPKPQSRDLKEIERRRLTPTLLAVWNVYKQLVYGPGPLPPSQEDECRRALYAGMAEMLKAFMNLPDDERQAMAILDTIRAEMRRVPALEFPETIAAPELFMGKGH